MAAPDDNPATRRIADDDFAGLSPVIEKRGFAVAHELFGQSRRGFRWLRRLLNLHVAFEHGAEKREPFDVEKRHVKHKRNQQHREAGRGVFNEFDAQRPAADFFNDRHQNVSAVKHGNRQQIDDREVDVEQHQKTQSQAIVTIRRIGEQGEDADRPGQILCAHARFS